MSVAAEYAYERGLLVTAYRAPNPEPPYDDPEPVRGPALPSLREAPPLGVQLRLVPDPEPPPADDREWDPQPTPRGDLEDPRPRAAVLARAFLEALCGDRPVGQLMRWTTAEVYAQLEPLVAARTPRPWAATLRRVLVAEPSPGVAEVTAIIQRGPRTGAMALRLEGLDGRWLVTALQLG